MKFNYTVAGIALGLIMGIPVGIGAYAYGYSAGTASKATIQVSDDTLCINGFAYEFVSTEDDSAWGGAKRLESVTESQPSYTDTGGQPVHRQALPVTCKIVRG